MYSSFPPSHAHCLRTDGTDGQRGAFTRSFSIADADWLTSKMRLSPAKRRRMRSGWWPHRCRDERGRLRWVALRCSSACATRIPITRRSREHGGNRKCHDRGGIPELCAATQTGFYLTQGISLSQARMTLK